MDLLLVGVWLQEIRDWSLKDRIQGKCVGACNVDDTSRNGLSGHVSREKMWKERHEVRRSKCGGGLGRYEVPPAGKLAWIIQKILELDALHIVIDGTKKDVEVHFVEPATAPVLESTRGASELVLLVLGQEGR